MIFMTLIILMNLNKDYKMQDVRKNFPSRISLNCAEDNDRSRVANWESKKVQPFPKPKISLAFAKF